MNASQLRSLLYRGLRSELVLRDKMLRSPEFAQKKELVKNIERNIQLFGEAVDKIEDAPGK